MKNREAWECYVFYTETASNNLRKLGFAATAICWVLKKPNNTFSGFIYTALIAIFLYFISDTFQYIFGASSRGEFIENREKEYFKESKAIEGEYYFPKDIDVATRRFWWAKIGFILFAYLLIGADFFYVSFIK